MRILFFCQYFPPDMGAPAARTYEHARHWVAMGHEVTVVCGLPNHPEGRVPEKYWRSVLYREEVDGIKVLRCWLYTTPNRGVIRRSLCFLTFMFSSALFGVLYGGRNDVIVATSPQILCGLAGYFVAWARRTPFVFEVRDLWPQQIIDLGTVRNPVAIRMLTWVEHLLYRRSRAIVTVAEATRKSLIDRGVDADKVFTITNGIEEDFYRVRDRNSPVRAEYSWGDDVVVMYIGTQGLSQGLATILDVAQQMTHREGLRFVFVGTGAQREMLVERAQAMGLRNVQFLPMQEKARMPDFYAAADICLVPLRNLEVFRYNIPSKMFEIMACGRPIVLGVKGQARELLDEAGAGIAVPPEDAAGFVAAIERLMDNPDLRREFGERGREHVVKNYTRAAKAADYARRLEKIVGLDGCENGVSRRREA